VHNLKIGGIIAGIAFILSFIIGLVNDISLPMLIFRAVLFAIIFLAIAILIKFLVSRFLPELLEESAEEVSPILQPGSRINITEGEDDAAPQAIPRPPVMGAHPDDSGEEGLGNISDLLSKNGANQVDSPQTGMDQNDQAGYNSGDGGLGEFSASSLASPELSQGLNEDASSALSSGRAPGDGETGSFSGSTEILPDLESMAGVFGPVSGAAESDSEEYSPPASTVKSSSRDKAVEWSGDFNPKDLAEGLRTVLSKEKEG